MFKELGNFGLQRTASQAFGFYLAYLLLLLVIAMILGMAFGLLSPDSENVFQRGVSIGAIISGVVCSSLSFMILKKKNLFGSFASFVYVVAAAGLALLAGVIGMILPAYLTTKAPAPTQETVL